MAVRKQVYLYGFLDPSPLVLNHGVGLAWSVGGWLMSPQEAGGAERYEALRQRVARELDTTFASRFGHEVGFSDLLDPQVLQGVARMATGEKYLVRPQA
jgi:NADPH2:quinone reductase